ncbi:citramalate synthase [Halobacteriales archaeon Cl-PHB]
MDLVDVTLRESAQMPGRDYEAGQRVAAGRALADLGVPYLQAGFPAAGKTEVAVTRELAAAVDATVVALARALPADVETAAATRADVVEVFGSVSGRHLESVIESDRESMLAALADAIDAVRDAGATPHVSLTDAFRTPPQTLAAALEPLPAVERVNLADSAGDTTPDEARDHLEALGEAGVDLESVGVHFHDDLGLATANVLIADSLGVGYADVSVASLGERVGNPALEEVVVATDLGGGDLDLATDELIPACESVLEALGEAVPDRKPVLGRAATEHEAGIHTAAMLADPATFEPYPPDHFGGQRRLLFGAGTGRSGAEALLATAGVPNPEDAVVDELLDRLTAEGPLDREGAVALAGSVADDV